MKHFLFWLFIISFGCAQSLTVGLNFEARQQLYPCLGYIAYELEKNQDILPYIMVSDFDTAHMIEPHNAYFVLNSRYKSVCSKYPIVAFANESRAKEFIKKYDGSIRNFDFALFVAKKDLEIDGAIIERRIHESTKKGKVLFEKFCKSDLKQCTHLKGNNKHYLQSYLTHQHILKEDITLNTMAVPKDAKCPVCGMFVSKYPKWAAQIILKNGKIYFFDGVKDMMKFYFEPHKFHHHDTANAIQSMFVTDYYTLEKIEALGAYFVIGSNIYGPMGHELIPFKKLDDANEFKKYHLGKSVVSFEEISQMIVAGLDK